MEILQVSALIGVFLVMAVLMFLRKLPALLALPLMAIFMPLVAGVHPEDIIQYVFGDGSVKLYQAYTVAMFGSMLSVILQKTGVAENFIKKGAELSGDSPWLIGVIMLFLIMLLFTTLGGLGAIIMVATIVLPIMASVGIGPMTTVGIFLLGLSIGGTLNVGNWAVYVSVMGLTVEEIRPFALIMFFLAFLLSILYLTIQLYRDGQNLNLKKIISVTLSVILVLGAFAYLYFRVFSDELIASINSVAGSVFDGLVWLIGVGIIALFIYSAIRAMKNKNQKTILIHWTSYFAPIIPLFLILLFDINFIAAFVVGLVYAFLSTYKRGNLSLFVKSVFEGGAVVMPAVVLMFGIGMLLVAIMGPGGTLEQYPNGWPVLNLLQPVIKSIVPTSPIMYVLIFTAMAPLALYRGPLNIWGMGYGLAAVLLASGMNPGAVMGLLLAVGQVQGVSDPTNTHNVWLANEMRVDVQKILWNTLPYTWLLALIGLSISAILFM